VFPVLALAVNAIAKIGVSYRAHCDPALAPLGDVVIRCHLLAEATDFTGGRAVLVAEAADWLAFVDAGYIGGGQLYWHDIARLVPLAEPVAP